MKSTDAPSKQAVPFGTNGPREAITPTTPSGSNQASYDQGFPPITMTLKSAGGLPPKGQDMNQILFEHGSFNRYFSAGGGYVYDSTFSTSIGGYPLGARIPNSTGNGYWLNTVQDNTVNPENTTSALTGWVPDRSYGVTAISGLVATSQILTTLAASKDRITLAGALTANINIVVPAWVKKWDVVNNCTGAFTVTIKTASGTGIAIPSGMTALLVGDGTNITLDLQILGNVGRLLNVQVITATGTYTPTAGTNTTVVEMVGGGGATAGVPASSSSANFASGGAGAGSYAKFLWTSPVATGVTIGAAGTSSGGTGTSGGATIFGSLATAPGGSGNVYAQATGSALIANGGSGGTEPTISSSVKKLESHRGQSGSPAVMINSGSGAGNNGGNSRLGTGGLGNGDGAGSIGSGYGAGGGGSMRGTNNTGSSATGANGTTGLIIIWEYS